MAVAFDVDVHPQREQILAMMVDKIPVRRIAAQVSPPIHFGAIQRYKQNKGLRWIEKTLRNIQIQHAQQLTSASGQPNQSLATVSQATASEVARQLLVTRLAERYEQVDADLMQTEAGKALSGKAALMQADRGYMELHSKLLGLLSDQTQNTVLVVAAPGASVTINAGMPAVESSSDPAEELETTLDLEPGEYTDEK